MPSYISRSLSGWKFRRAVPIRLRARLGLTELTKSISPRPYAAACREARRLANMTDRLLMHASDPQIPDDQLKALARSWFEKRLVEVEAGLTARSPADVDDEVRDLKYVDRRAEGMKNLILLNDVGVAEPIVGELLARIGVSQVDLDRPDHRSLARLVLRAEQAVAEIERSRIRGDYGSTVSDSLFGDAGAYLPPLPAAPVAVPTPSPLFSEAYAAFVQVKLDRGKTKDGSIGQLRQSAKLLIGALGDRPVASLTRQSMIDFANKLRLMPARYGKDHRGRTVDEEIAHAEATGARRMDANTVHGHFKTISGFLGWCVDKAGIETVKPASIDDITEPKNVAEHELRRGWSIDELKALFRTPTWKGHRPAQREQPGPQIDFDHHFWLPILALWTGARLEELAGADVDHIVERDGVVGISIEPTEDRGLKTHASRRFVPFHAEIIRLGFLIYVSERKQAGEKKLFPMLRPGGRDRRYGAQYTKDFSRLRTKHDIIGPDFHSFRHTLNTALVNANVQALWINRLIGHSAGKGDGRAKTETSRYTDKISVSNLKAAIDKLTLPDLGIPIFRGSRSRPE